MRDYFEISEYFLKDISSINDLYPIFISLCYPSKKQSHERNNIYAYNMDIHNCQNVESMKCF